MRALICLIALAGCAPEAALTVALSPSTVAVGEPVTATLTATVVGNRGGTIEVSMFAEYEDLEDYDAGVWTTTDAGGGEVVEDANTNSTDTILFSTDFAESEVTFKAELVCSRPISGKVFGDYHLYTAKDAPFRGTSNEPPTFTCE